jgi:6-phosphogluconolactonase
MKQTVYTASPESQQIHVWRLNAEGTLTLVQVVDARTGSADGHQPG